MFHVRGADVQCVGDNQVRVPVGAFALNPVDLKTQSGESKMILPSPPLLVSGVGVAGTIDAVGKDVRHLKAGDRVFSYTGMGRVGAFAQAVVLYAGRVAKAPAKASMAPAACGTMLVLRRASRRGAHGVA